MAVRKIFGESPRRKIFVRVQEVDGQKVLSTQSFSIYGQEIHHVAHTVERALESAYSDGGHVPVTRPKLTIKRGGSHGR